MLWNRGRIPAGLRWGLLSVVLAVMLFAALRPWGYSFRNTASLRTDPPGLTFGARGLAFTRSFVSEDDSIDVNTNGLTLALEIDVADESPDGFAAIAVLHNGNDTEQLFLGQWRQHLVLMNGDDYAHKRRLPRISVDTAKFPTGRLQLRITSDSSGSTLFVDGERVDHRPDLVLTVPVHGRLTLGNAPDGKHPWNGRLHHFRMDRKSYEPGPSTDGFQPGPQSRISDLEYRASPWVSYRFDPGMNNEEGARRVADQSGNAIDLEFPLDTAFLTREFLGPGTVAPFIEEVVSRDGLLNFFGFIPLGWIVAGLIGSRQFRSRGFILIAAATAAGFGLSLGIEYLQTWMPTRSSSLLDLILNTAGTFAGAGLACVTAGRRPDESTDPEAP